MEGAVRLKALLFHGLLLALPAKTFSLGPVTSKPQFCSAAPAIPWSISPQIPPNTRRAAAGKAFPGAALWGPVLWASPTFSSFHSQLLRQPPWSPITEPPFQITLRSNPFYAQGNSKPMAILQKGSHFFLSIFSLAPQSSLHRIARPLTCSDKNLQR